jgi:hypothetical protein
MPIASNRRRGRLVTNQPQTRFPDKEKPGGGKGVRLTSPPRNQRGKKQQTTRCPWCGGRGGKKHRRRTPPWVGGVVWDDRNATCRLFGVGLRSASTVQESTPPFPPAQKGKQKIKRVEAGAELLSVASYCLSSTPPSLFFLPRQIRRRLFFLFLFFSSSLRLLFFF